MKPFLLLTSLFFSTIISAQQKNFSGTWQGNVDSGVTHLKLIFHFNKNSRGAYSGTFDSPNQGVSGLDFTTVSAINDTLFASVNVLRATYKGYWENDSTLTGKWQQGMTSFPLNMRRTGQEKTAGN
ncbi:MAG: hypothetical protein LBE82_00605 [Chitinophagaceae bacterium]|jgi:hypothetical protein|nr:hypothetical protein [Chitinophagaceae bacterium]